MREQVLIAAMHVFKLRERIHLSLHIPYKSCSYSCVYLKCIYLFLSHTEWPWVSWAAPESHTSLLASWDCFVNASMSTPTSVFHQSDPDVIAVVSLVLHSYDFDSIIQHFLLRVRRLHLFMVSKKNLVYKHMHVPSISDSQSLRTVFSIIGMHSFNSGHDVTCSGHSSFGAPWTYCRLFGSILLQYHSSIFCGSLGLSTHSPHGRRPNKSMSL